MDAVDRILGRAMVDSAFGRALLANPAAALAAEPMSLALKRLLIGIRAGSLKEFALRALEAQECLQANLAAHEAARDQAPAELSLAGVGTLAGAGA